MGGDNKRIDKQEQSKQRVFILRSHLLGSSHQTTDERDNQSASDVANILGDEPNSGTHLSGNGNGELGVCVGFVVVAARGDHVVVDVAALHAVENVEQEDTIAERVVLEAANGRGFAALLGHAVGPGDHVGVADFALAHALGECAEGVDNVFAHQLPDHAESQSTLAVGDIGTLDSNKRETVLLADFDGIVCVFDSLETHEFVAAGGTLVDMAPLYRARNDLVIGLEQNGTVTEVVEKGDDSGLDVQTVEPEGENTSLTLTFSIKVFNIGLFFFGNGIKTGVGVEQVGDKGKVELGVTSDEGFGGQEFATVELVGIVEDLFGALHEVAGLKRRTRANVGLELVEEDCIVFAILDVAGKVGNTVYRQMSC